MPGGRNGNPIVLRRAGSSPKRDQQVKKPTNKPNQATAPKIRNTKHLPKFKDEKELRDFLSQNLHVIERGLKLFHIAENHGVEVPCRITTWGRQGSIDILAQDRDGALVVIECKQKYGDAMAFGQMLGYIAWVRVWMRAVEKVKRKVRACLVCKRANPLLKLLLSEHPGFDVTVYEFEFSVEIEDVGQNSIKAQMS